ncbi:hypothetical protein BHYA_0349g00040 [Botrytis hyacinthi]|uniref:Uncharacterized protein n=1 Tax=Botrytis hyacinthi TaxID=278943 RepID=A0A4Z1G5A1_9HELO|nr:hypothetical protein BHYA_0349g00040 [Botrytis hyacinthi]
MTMNDIDPSISSFDQVRLTVRGTGKREQNVNRDPKTRFGDDGLDIKTSDEKKSPCLVEEFGSVHPMFL